MSSRFFCMNITERMTIDELHTLWDSKNERPRKHPTQGEHVLQVECLRWLRLAYPSVLCYAIPNGGQRNAIVAAKLKEEGATAGIPDMHIPIPKGGYASLYIEMKNGKAGRLSEHQKEMIQRLQAFGNKVVVCRTFDEFRKEITNYLSL